jgi:hypothetical protein
MHCDRIEELSKFEVPMRKNSYVGKPLLTHRITAKTKTAEVAKREHQKAD